MSEKAYVSAFGFFSEGDRNDQLSNNMFAIINYNLAISIIENEIGPIELKNNPEWVYLYSSCYNNRGHSYGKINNHHTANNDFTKAIEIINHIELEQLKRDPGGVFMHSNFYNSRGSSYGIIDNHHAAINDQTKAIEIIEYIDIKQLIKNPEWAYEYSSFYNNRGLSYAAINNHHAGIKDYTKAIEIAEKHNELKQLKRNSEWVYRYSVFYNNRGLSYFKINNLDAAIGDYTKAIKIIEKQIDREELPDHLEWAYCYSSYYHSRGQSYYFKNNIADALADTEQAITFIEQIINRTYFHQTPKYIDSLGLSYISKWVFNNFLTPQTADPKTIEHGISLRFKAGLVSYNKHDNSQELKYYDKLLQDLNNPKIHIGYTSPNIRLIEIAHDVRVNTLSPDPLPSISIQTVKNYLKHIEEREPALEDDKDWTFACKTLRAMIKELLDKITAQESVTAQDFFDKALWTLLSPSDNRAAALAHGYFTHAGQLLEQEGKDEDLYWKIQYWTTVSWTLDNDMKEALDRFTRLAKGKDVRTWLMTMAFMNMGELTFQTGNRELALNFLTKAVACFNPGSFPDERKWFSFRDRAVSQGKDAFRLRLAQNLYDALCHMGGTLSRPEDYLFLMFLAAPSARGNGVGAKCLRFIQGSISPECEHFSKTDKADILYDFFKKTLLFLKDDTAHSNTLFQMGQTVLGQHAVKETFLAALSVFRDDVAELSRSIHEIFKDPLKKELLRNTIEHVFSGLKGSWNTLCQAHLDLHPYSDDDFRGKLWNPFWETRFPDSPERIVDNLNKETEGITIPVHQKDQVHALHQKIRAHLDKHWDKQRGFYSNPGLAGKSVLAYLRALYKIKGLGYFKRRKKALDRYREVYEPFFCVPEPEGFIHSLNSSVDHLFSSLSETLTPEMDKEVLGAFSTVSGHVEKGLGDNYEKKLVIQEIKSTLFLNLLDDGSRDNDETTEKSLSSHYDTLMTKFKPDSVSRESIMEAISCFYRESDVFDTSYMKELKTLIRSDEAVVTWFKIDEATWQQVLCYPDDHKKNLKFSIREIVKEQGRDELIKTLDWESLRKTPELPVKGLIEALQKEIKGKTGIRTLLILPHSPLNNIPWMALFDQDNSSGVRLSVIPSLKSWMTARKNSEKASSKGKGGLVAGLTFDDAPQLGEINRSTSRLLKRKLGDRLLHITNENVHGFALAKGITGVSNGRSAVTLVASHGYYSGSFSCKIYKPSKNGGTPGTNGNRLGTGHGKTPVAMTGWHLLANMKNSGITDLSMIFTCHNARMDGDGYYDNIGFPGLFMATGSSSVVGALEKLDANVAMTVSDHMIRHLVRGKNPYDALKTAICYTRELEYPEFRKQYTLFIDDYAKINENTFNNDGMTEVNVLKFSIRKWIENGRVFSFLRKKRIEMLLSSMDESLSDKSGLEEIFIELGKVGKLPAGIKQGLLNPKEFSKTNLIWHKVSTEFWKDYLCLVNELGYSSAKENAPIIEHFKPFSSLDKTAPISFFGDVQEKALF